MRWFTLLAISLFALSTAHSAPDAAKPNVRAITAFVKLDRARYETQVDDTMKVLNAAKTEFAKRGYETQTVRIVTQPFAELVAGPREQRLDRGRRPIHHRADLGVAHLLELA